MKLWDKADLPQDQMQMATMQMMALQKDLSILCDPPEQQSAVGGHGGGGVTVRRHSTFYFETHEEL